MFEAVPIFAIVGLSMNVVSLICISAAHEYANGMRMSKMSHRLLNLALNCSVMAGGDYWLGCSLLLRRGISTFHDMIIYWFALLRTHSGCEWTRVSDLILTLELMAPVIGLG